MKYKVLYSFNGKNRNNYRRGQCNLHYFIKKRGCLCVAASFRKIVFRKILFLDNLGSFAFVAGNDLYHIVTSSEV